MVGNYRTREQIILLLAYLYSVVHVLVTSATFFYLGKERCVVIIIKSYFDGSL